MPLASMTATRHKTDWSMLQRGAWMSLDTQTVLCTCISGQQHRHEDDQTSDNIGLLAS